MLAGTSGAHYELPVGLSKFKDLLARFGIRCHAREGKHRWPASTIPWSDFAAETEDNVVRIEDKKAAKRDVITSGEIRASARCALDRVLPEIRLVDCSWRFLPVAPRLERRERLGNYGIAAFG